MQSLRNGLEPKVARAADRCERVARGVRSLLPPLRLGTEAEGADGRRRGPDLWLREEEHPGYSGTAMRYASDRVRSSLEAPMRYRVPRSVIPSRSRRRVSPRSSNTDAASQLGVSPKSFG